MNILNEFVWGVDAKFCGSVLCSYMKLPFLDTSTVGHCVSGSGLNEVFENLIY